MKLDKKSMLLYAVTDRAWVGKQTLYQQVESAIKGGATCVQLREKDLDENTFLNEAIQISGLCKKYGVPFFINDNVDIAIKSNADGVHVGQEDMVAWQVRKMVGNEMFIGVSVHTVEQALAAVKNGADCLGVGAMFSTSTKTDADVLSKQTLHDICSAVDVPVVAIGGINKRNISQLAGTGVDGVALVSAIFSAEDIESECRLLSALSKEMVESANVKCAIFDFDGTLFDSMFIWDNAGDVFLSSLGKKAKPSLREDLRPLSLYQSACYLQKEYDLTLSVQQIMNGINKTIEHFYINEVLPKVGVVDFLQQMKNAGIRMCIATASDRFHIQSALCRCGMAEFFEEIFTCDEVGCGKDQPVVFQKAMEFFGANRSNTLVFEDALHAIKTAKDDGFAVVGVFDNSETRQNEIRQLADCYIADFKDTNGFWNFVHKK
ncbi:MAG: thiamine phosphate synthase [Clostridia bacterium]|nr:thiamine phosphate synthase [Clostridia bacterium]